MNIRLIASDVDGTILPRGGQISDRTRNAVHDCQKNGIEFVVATGRWYVSAKDIADRLQLTEGWMIVANGGAVVKMDGTILKEWTMTDGDAARAYEIFRRRNVMVTAFVHDAVYRMNTKAIQRRVRGLGDYLGGRYHMINDDPAIFESRGLKSPYKLEAYGDDPAVMAELKAEMAEAGFAVSSAYADNMEVMAPGCGKGTALKWLAGELSVEMSECMAFGDNLNDLTMLEAAGWPVAVENAVDELKSKAKIVAPDCGEDGVAQIIERLIGGKL